ncbi:UNVERIFIED_CONTAM: hypothetical protein GTU68_060774 [Idotea baltica]|nr:hypothetical protein [Idotea baltica]
MLLDPSEEALSDRAEALLMAADRAQHVAELVRPTLNAGRHVVSDRYSYSSIAYQGYGRGLPVDEVRELSEWATNGCTPDLVLLLTVPADIAASRLGDSLDRFEKVGGEFHERVQAGYEEMAANDPARWRVVPAVGDIAEIQQAILDVVLPAIGAGDLP